MRKMTTLAAALLMALPLFPAAVALAEDPAPAAPPTPAPAAKEEAKPAADAAALNTMKERISYAIGTSVAMGLGQQLKQSGIEVNPDVLAAAIRDTLHGKPQMSEEEVGQVLMQMQKDHMAREQAKAGENKAAGEAYLAKNGKAEGVKTTASGLQYKTLREGQGKSPTAADTVTVHYRGTLINGDEFDSSYKRGEPVSFPLQNVIPGWTEGLQLMKEGGKYELTIPANLAYGDNAPPSIGPGSTLIFEIELLKIGPAK